MSFTSRGTYFSEICLGVHSAVNSGSPDCTFKATLKTVGGLPGAPACCPRQRRRDSAPPCTLSSPAQPPVPPPPASPHRSATASSEGRRKWRRYRKVVIFSLEQDKGQNPRIAPWWQAAVQVLNPSLSM